LLLGIPFVSVCCIYYGSNYIPSESQLEQFLALWSNTYRLMIDKDEILLQHSLAYTHIRKLGETVFE
jgi:hypothetical protein